MRKLFTLFFVIICMVSYSSTTINLNENKVSIVKYNFSDEDGKR